MELSLGSDSRAMVEVRSKGLIAALEHHVIFTGGVEPFKLSVPDEGLSSGVAPLPRGPLDVEVRARVAVAGLLPPESVARSDREKMIDNLRGEGVLDMKRHPHLELAGRYTGTIESGKLAGDITLRGSKRPIVFTVTGAREGSILRVKASWEGAQTSLGLKPFKALLGALKLEDWARIRLELSFSV
jgi:hypothetical protein